MKLQFLFTILLIAIVAVFAKDATVGSAAPVAAAPVSVEASPAFQKLVKTSDDTVSKVKSLVSEVATLKQAVDTLTKENAQLKATLQQLVAADDSFSTRITKLDEVVAAFNAKIADIKTAAAGTPIAKQAEELFATAKVAAEKYFAVARAQGVLYYKKAAEFADKNAGPALKSARVEAVKLYKTGSVKAVELYNTAIAEGTVLFKKTRADLTVFLLSKGVPADKAPLVALSVIATVVLFALILAFTVIFKVLGLIFRTLCCCCCGNSKPRKAAAAGASTASGKGHTHRK